MKQPPPKDQQRIFETIQLPELIKNLTVPELILQTPDGKERTLFKRRGKEFEIHKIADDMLRRHNNLFDVLKFLSEQTETRVVIFCDDFGPKRSLILDKTKKSKIEPKKSEDGVAFIK